MFISDAHMIPSRTQSHFLHLLSQLLPLAGEAADDTKLSDRTSTKQIHGQVQQRRDQGHSLPRRPGLTDLILGHYLSYKSCGNSYIVHLSILQQSGIRQDSP